MLQYSSAYRWEDRVCLGEVIDFPGTVACGETLDLARVALADALQDMAETNILRGEALPMPVPGCSDPGAELIEPIFPAFIRR